MSTSAVIAGGAGGFAAVSLARAFPVQQLRFRTNCGKQGELDAMARRIVTVVGKAADDIVASRSSR